jgi:hypothetical protein
LGFSLTLAVCAGCADAGAGVDRADSSVTTEVADSAGVVVVTNRGAGWSTGAGWALEPDLQVGEIDGPLAFGRVAWVSPGPARGLLVLDAQSHLVHVFDSAGRHLHAFGGEGDGPGEFRRPSLVTLVDGDRLAVAQSFPPVLHWLALDGSFRRSTRLPGARSEGGTRTAGTFGLWQVTSSGRVFTQVQIIDPSAEDGEMPVILVHVPVEVDATPDTVAEWTWQAGFDNDSPIRMFDPVHTWMPAPEGSVILAAGAPYEFRKIDPDGGLVQVVRREVASVPLTDAHRARALADFRESMESGGGPADFIDEMLDRVEFGASVPDVLRVWVSDPDGRVWVGVYDPEVEASGPAPTGVRANAWDVFEADGTLLGRVSAPHGFRLTVATEEALYGVWEDELEVPFARRYRVVRPSPARLEAAHQE